MKKTLFSFMLGLAVGLLLMPMHAQEKITVGTPVVPATPPTLSGYVPVTLSVTRLVAGYTTASNISAMLAPADASGNPIPGTPIVISYPDPSVAALSTEAQVATLINNFKSANLSTAYTGANSGNLWQRIQFFACRDFPQKFSGGCSTIQ